MNKMESLTSEELLSVLRLAKQNSDRDHCMLLICYTHGMRASECATLKPGDVSMKDKTICIKRCKGSLQTTDALKPNSNRLLDELKTVESWLRRRPADSPFLFPSRKHARMSRVQVFRIYRRYAEAAGLPANKLGIHALKHTIGQRMADSGADIKVMRLALGLKLITSTQRYFEVTAAQADAARHAAILSA
jgi:type 1 fimbriae regulatory protein FimB